MNTNFYIPTEPAVKNAIHGIWQVNHHTSFSKEYILPKGVVEVIFNFSNGTPITAALNSRSCLLPNCFINGFNKMPIEVALPRQQFFLGVLFQPLATRKIFGCPAAEFSDITVDLTLIDKDVKSLWQQLAEQDNFNQRVQIVLGWLKTKLTDWHPQEQFINHFLYDLNQHDLSVTELARAVCYSPRHLSRKIFEATGMNTEEILLYKKYLHAIHLMHHTDLPLTAIAYQSQFADQSHFIKSFKTYTSITPGEYKRNKSVVKGHLFKDVR